jgi:aldose 1-epimerase
MNRAIARITLNAGAARLELAPAFGGAVAGYTRAGFALMRKTPPEADEGRLLACYPLFPFSNRIALGTFTFAGQRHELWRHAVGFPHAIHGEGWVNPWRVAEASTTEARLVYDHDTTGEGSWPFPFRAEQHFSLAEDALAVVLGLANTGRTPMPAGMGLHPFFPRHGDTVLGFGAASVWRNGADHLPSERIPPPAGWRFDPPRALGDPGLDNCFAGWSGTARIAWPGAGLGLEIAADACFGHAVVYTPADQDHFAFEPVSHMNDAINRMDAVADHGLVVLDPGASLTGRIRFAVRRLTPA